MESGPGEANQSVATAIRTLLAAGLLVDSAHRKPDYIAVSCHRVDDFGIAVPYLIVLGAAVSSTAAAAAAAHAAHEGAHLVIVSDDYLGDAAHLSWAQFLGRLGGPLKSYLPLEDGFAVALAELGCMRLPDGLTGNADTLFEEYVLAALQFVVGNRVIRYGQDRRFERVPDGVGFAGDPPIFFMYDAKAASEGYEVSLESVRQFGDYVRRFNDRYRINVGGIHSFLVVSGSFAGTPATREERSNQLYADCGVRLSFLMAAALGEICAALRAHVTVRSSLPWREIFARLQIDATSVVAALAAAQRDGLAR